MCSAGSLTARHETPELGIFNGIESPTGAGVFARAIRRGVIGFCGSGSLQFPRGDATTPRHTASSLSCSVSVSDSRNGASNETLLDRDIFYRDVEIEAETEQEAIEKRSAAGSGMRIIGPAAASRGSAASRRWGGSR